MAKYMPTTKGERLLQLSEEVSRIAGSLAQLSVGLTGQAKANEPERISNKSDVSEDIVDWLIKARRARGRYLSHELFSEPAWDILLDLLRAEIARQRVPVTSLCVASGAAATTALRCLKGMEQQGMIVRRADPHDRRRVFVELAPQTSTALREYFADVVRPGTIIDHP
jgi:DNA-binding MarR family transcriptional regulator